MNKQEYSTELNERKSEFTRIVLAEEKYKWEKARIIDDVIRCTSLSELTEIIKEYNEWITRPTIEERMEELGIELPEGYIPSTDLPL